MFIDREASQPLPACSESPGNKANLGFPMEKLFPLRPLRFLPLRTGHFTAGPFPHHANPRRAGKSRSTRSPPLPAAGIFPFPQFVSRDFNAAATARTIPALPLLPRDAPLPPGIARGSRARSSGWPGMIPNPGLAGEEPPPGMGSSPAVDSPLSRGDTRPPQIPLLLEENPSSSSREPPETGILHPQSFRLLHPAWPRPRIPKTGSEQRWEQLQPLPPPGIEAAAPKPPAALGIGVSLEFWLGKKSHAGGSGWALNPQPGGVSQVLGSLIPLFSSSSSSSSRGIFGIWSLPCLDLGFGASPPPSQAGQAGVVQQEIWGSFS
ncbi:protein transport protein Sec31B-like [Corvus moneduloides]|uniref:protein transport protein Sec31B-like n=1 Tax=Corvus moneduloides TaxID=1196302 RepID=UPI001363E7ED|nr:protein transport protein Sec31B-like [Corvus moneduloides]